MFRATKMVYGVEPDLTREGGSIPVTLTLQEATGNGQRTYIHTNTHEHLQKQTCITNTFTQTQFTGTLTCLQTIVRTQT